MGWLQLARKSQSHISLASNLTPKDNTGQTQHFAHVENVAQSDESSTALVDRKHPFVPETMSFHELPVIAKEEVLARRPCSSQETGKMNGVKAEESTNKARWIVIDNVVYDCTHFISEHPGGEQVIHSFVGEDCSWQFWRFHGKNVMEEYGLPLRIGRTEGVKNRFAEPSRYVGLSRLGDDDW